MGSSVAFATERKTSNKKNLFSLKSQFSLQWRVGLTKIRKIVIMIQNKLDKATKFNWEVTKLELFYFFLKKKLCKILNVGGYNTTWKYGILIWWSAARQIQAHLVCTMNWTQKVMCAKRFRGARQGTINLEALMKLGSWHSVARSRTNAFKIMYGSKAPFKIKERIYLI